MSASDGPPSRRAPPRRAPPEEPVAVEPAGADRAADLHPATDPAAEEGIDDQALATQEQQQVAALVRKAAAPVTVPKGRVLRGTQARIRSRSGGRFFADRWSVGHGRPMVALVALTLLLLAVLTFLALRPTVVP